MGIDRIGPDSLFTLVQYFLVGFVARYTYRRVVGHRTEPDLTMTVMSVVWSVLLTSLLQIIGAPVPAWVPASLQGLFAAGSYLLAAALGAYLVGRGRLGVGSLDMPWLNLAKRSQLIVEEIERSEGSYVEVQVGTDWYSGMIERFDRDPERFADLHISLSRVAKLIDGSWQALPQVQLVLSLADIQVLAIVRPLPALGSSSEREVRAGEYADQAKHEPHDGA